MADKLPTALSAARTKVEKPANQDKITKSADEDIEKTEAEEPEGLTAEELRLAREAYLRAWPLDEAYEKR
jgi:hypothetical protein